VDVDVEEKLVKASNDFFEEFVFKVRAVKQSVVAFMRMLGIKVIERDM